MSLFKDETKPDKVFKCEMCGDTVSCLTQLKYGPWVCCYCHAYNSPDFDWLKVKVTPSMIEYAKDRAKQIMYEADVKHLKSQFQTNRKENHEQGCLAECIIEAWLKENNYRFKDLKVLGKSDKGDYILYGKVFDLKSGHRILDLKIINPYSNNFCFQVLATQTLKDCYVNVIFDNKLEYGYITGMISREELLKLPVRYDRFNRPTREVNFSKLKSFRKWCVISKVKWEEAVKNNPFM